jgi:hypothetical protein
MIAIVASVESIRFSKGQRGLHYPYLRDARAAWTGRGGGSDSGVESIGGGLSMKLLIAAVPFVAVLGCAGPEARLAQADCRIAPITTASLAGKAKRVDPLERRMAEMHLGSTELRRRHLDRGPYEGLVEESLRDCR